MGAGRKPKNARMALIHNSRDRGTRTVGADGQALADVQPPEDLPDDERAVWDRLAPLALSRGTLTPAEADAFADLCETIVVAREMLVEIRKDGMVQARLSTRMDESGGGDQTWESKAHPLIAKWTALKARIATEKGRFLLTGTGKPVVSTAPKTVSVVERLQQQAKQMRGGQ